MLNPFKISLLVALVVAVVAAVGFILVVFVQNGGHASSLGVLPAILETL